VVRQTDINNVHTGRVQIVATADNVQHSASLVGCTVDQLTETVASQQTVELDGVRICNTLQPDVDISGQ